MHYWIVINDNTKGPLTLDELLQIPGLSPATPVWFDGLANWTTIGQVPDLMERLMQPRNTAQPSAQPQPQPQAFASSAPTYGMAAPTQAPGSSADSLDPMRPCPPNHLVWAIIVTICCCLPAGIVALIYSSKVQPAWRAGRYEEAEKASETAMWWVIGGFVGGLVIQPFVSIMQLMTL